MCPPRLILLLFALFLGNASARPVLDKPNVIVVLLDDCGYGDFAHTGNPTIRTPNITRLVNEGLNFPQFYTASPACSASRYSLLTGRYPNRSGFPRWVLDSSHARHIHPDEVTIAEGLRAGGYATAIFGKWHVGMPTAANGNTPQSLPLAHGFDRFLGTTLSNDGNGSLLLRAPSAANTPVAGYELLSSTVRSDRQLQSTLTATYTDQAVAFIREKKDQPFFLYLAYNMPHLPVHPGADFAGKSPRGALGDVIEEIDHAMGRLRSTLEGEGIAENTLVVFTSDNGPWVRFYKETSNGYYGDARLDVGHSGPFRDGKGSTWEGGIRVPGVFWWPGIIGPATVVTAPASTLDLLPTVLRLAGQTVPTDRILDGRDIRPYLNPTHFPGSPPEFTFIYTGQEDNRVMAVRKGPWKLHTAVWSQTGDNYGFSASRAAPLLFHLEQDPGETVNRSAGNAAIISSLLGEIDAHNAARLAEGTFWD